MVGVVRFLLLIVFLFVNYTLTGQVVQGRITDGHSIEPLSYASVGIKNKNGGGIADRSGSFSIDLSGLNQADSIVFSHIGYQPTVIGVRGINATQNLEIKLTRAAHSLEEFVVTAKVDVLPLGNTKHSGRFTGWGDYHSSRGRARGLQIEPKEFPVKLTGFVCRVKYNSFDSVKVRINMFKKTDGTLSQMLTSNIYQTAPKNSRWIKVDLTPYNIILKDTLVLAIEWVDSWSGGKKAGDENELFTISTGKKDGYCYERNTPNEVPRFQPCSELPTMYLQGYRTGKKSTGSK